MHHLSLQRTLAAALAMVMGCPFVGCLGIPAPGELASRDHVQKVLRKYRPDGAAPRLPRLTSGASPETFVRYAIYQHPQVEAAGDAY